MTKNVRQEEDNPPYLWRYREELNTAEDIDTLFVIEPDCTFWEMNPGEVTIVTWRGRL